MVLYNDLELELYGPYKLRVLCVYKVQWSLMLKGFLSCIQADRYSVKRKIKVLYR